MPNQLAYSQLNDYKTFMKARRRLPKQHVQQELFRHGGKRAGAGRKPNGPRAGAPHNKRPEIRPYHPLHVVLRVTPAVGSLRRRQMYQVFRDATVVAAVREWIRIVHISLQRTHIHLIVEADDRRLLARGMQGLQISAARRINTLLGNRQGQRRRGPVFADRYHLEVITSPKQARHAIAYVNNNWRKHREDQSGLAATWLVDPFSSGISFPDWQELDGKPTMWPLRVTYDPLMVRRPRSWLLSEGWKRHGPIGAHHVPRQR